MLILPMNKLIDSIESKKTDVTFDRVGDKIESYICVDEDFLSNKPINILEFNLEYDEESTASKNEELRDNIYTSTYVRLNTIYISFYLKFKGKKVNEFTFEYDKKYKSIKIVRRYFENKAIYSLSFEQIKEICESVDDENNLITIKIDDLINKLKEKTGMVFGEIESLIENNYYLKNMASNYVMLLMTIRYIIDNLNKVKFSPKNKTEEQDNKNKVNSIKEIIKNLFYLYHNQGNNELYYEQTSLLSNIEFKEFVEYDLLADQFNSFNYYYSDLKDNYLETDDLIISAVYKAEESTILSILKLKDNQKALKFEISSKHKNYHNNFRINSIAEYNVSNNDIIYCLISRHEIYQPINRITESDYIIELDSEQALNLMRAFKYIKSYENGNNLFDYLLNEIFPISRFYSERYKINN